MSETNLPAPAPYDQGMASIARKIALVMGEMEAVGKGGKMRDFAGKF